MPGEWNDRQTGLDSPAKRYVAVTPHDSTDLTVDARGLYVGTAGNVVAVSTSGDVVTFTNVQAGTILPINVRRVNATSTTASNIVALW
jgi:hypothetical protein